ncbi:MAG: right-handed parallel beta-helix repeat-containing protein [Rikenellaceae bacterium]
MNYKHFARTLVATTALLFSYSCATTQGESSVEIASSVSDDATYEVLCKIKEVKASGANSLTFEKGTYYFYPDKAVEKYCYISNHNDELTRVAFDLEDIHDLTIDGNGSTFIFHGRMIPFLVNSSSNITIKNLTIDFEHPFHSEATVIAHNTRDKSFDVEISEEFPYEIRNNQLIFVRPYYDHNVGQSMIYDEERVAPIYQTENYSIWNSKKVKHSNGISDFEYKYKTDRNDRYIKNQGLESSLFAEQIKPGVVRITGASKKLPPIGSIYVTKGDQGSNRFAPAFKMNDVDGLYAENVIVNHAGGMAFLFENCSDVDLYKCQVVPSNGRMISSTADATHFVGCRGTVSLRDCVFQSQLDDAMNVHGTYQEIMDIIDNKTLGIRMGHYQQLGFTLARVGDSVGVVRLSDSFHAYHTLTVKSIEFINGRYQTITFEEELPKQIKAGDLLENLSAYPEILVENCDISRNRARGLLISSPVKTTVRNNFFSTEMEALLLPVESGLWYESGNAANVTIEGNTFQDCPNGGMSRGVIRFHTDDKTGNIAFNNIKITGNTFNHFDNWVLELANIDGVEFSGNTINFSDTFPQQFPQQPVVTIEHCKNLIFKDNIYNGKATKMIQAGEGAPNVEFN